MANSLFYSKTLPPSFLDGTKVGGVKLEALTGANAAATYRDTFGLAPGETPEFGVAPPSAAGEQAGWTFICAPEDISWNIANASNRVEIFGTNNPPVTAGTKGMRDLSLNNSLVEGFVRKVTVEAKIASLEKLLLYSLNSSDGFVSVPVYEIWANSKSYGGSSGSAGYFIFKDIRVNEKLRDLKGNTTRATVDVSFTQVPAYQVNTGRDSASKTTGGGNSKLQQNQTQANSKGAQNTQVANQTKQNTPGNTAGAGGPTSTGTGGQSKPAGFTGSGLGEFKYTAPPKR